MMKNRKKEPILVNAEALLTFSKSKLKKGLRCLSKKTIKTYKDFDVSRVRKFAYMGGQTLINELNKKDQLEMLLTYKQSTTIILRKDFDKLKKKLKKLGFSISSTEIIDVIDGMISSDLSQKESKEFITAVGKEVNSKNDYECNDCDNVGNFSINGSCNMCGESASSQCNFDTFSKTGKLKKVDKGL